LNKKKKIEAKNVKDGAIKDQKRKKNKQIK